MRLTLYKYHGQDKDYLVYDTIQNHRELNKAMIRMLCDRSSGFGSDGIILGPELEENQIGMRLFSPDGSETRHDPRAFPVFAKYLKDNLYVTAESFLLQTADGTVKVHYEDEAATDITVTADGADGKKVSCSSRPTAIGTMILAPEYLETLVV